MRLVSRRRTASSSSCRGTREARRNNVRRQVQGNANKPTETGQQGMRTEHGHGRACSFVAILRKAGWVPRVRTSCTVRGVCVMLRAQTRKGAQCHPPKCAQACIGRYALPQCLIPPSKRLTARSHVQGHVHLHPILSSTASPSPSRSPPRCPHLRPVGGAHHHHALPARAPHAVELHQELRQQPPAGLALALTAPGGFGWTVGESWCGLSWHWHSQRHGFGQASRGFLWRARGNHQAIRIGFS